MRLSSPATALLALVGLAAAVPGVSPATVERAVDAGSSFDIDKLVETPEVVPNPDVVLLVDVTASMGGAIANIRTNLAAVITAIKTQQPSARLAVASFGDFAEPNAFAVGQGLTDVEADLQAAVNSLSATGGGDIPEDWINALHQLAKGGAVTWRADASKVIVLVGDAVSHDPSGGNTLLAVTAELQEENIRVIAVNVGGLDASGQATAVTAATGGVIVAADATAVTDAIVSGITSIEVVVKPEVVSCDEGLTLAFDPVTAKVASGATASFKETATVAATATPGATLTCSVRFLLNDAPGGDAFVQTVTVTINGAPPTDPPKTCKPKPYRGRMVRRN